MYCTLLSIHSCIYTHPHSLTKPKSKPKPTQSLTDLLTHLLADSLTHSLTHSLIHSFTHSLTHSLTHVHNSQWEHMQEVGPDQGLLLCLGGRGRVDRLHKEQKNTRGKRESYCRILIQQMYKGRGETRINKA